MVEPVNTSGPRASLWIIWLMTTAAPVFYAMVAYSIRPSGDLTPRLPDLADPLQLAITVAALGGAVAGLVVPRMMVARVRARIADPRTLPDDERDRLLNKPLTVRYALFDWVALLGMLLVFVGAGAAASLPFCAVALALLLAHPPTPSRLASLLGD